MKLKAVCSDLMTQYSTTKEQLDAAHATADEIQAAATARVEEVTSDAHKHMG